MNTQFLNIKGKTIGFKSFIFCLAFYNKYLTHRILHECAVHCVVENARYKMSMATNEYICSKREQTQHAAAALIRKPCLFPHFTNDSAFPIYFSNNSPFFSYLNGFCVFTSLPLKLS